MPKPIGRPHKENPKNTRIQIRLDKETLEKLDKCAEKKNTTRSGAIRDGIDLLNEELKEK